MAIIELRNVSKSFKGQKVLDGLNLEIEERKTTIIIGKSGGGKSVMLKHIIGLLKPDSGEIFIEGKPTTKSREPEHKEIRKMFGMLFQEAALFDSLNVYENVAFPLREHTRKSEAEIAIIVAERLAAVGLFGIESKMPGELSGGMRKRVGLARAIALQPKIVLFDEPTTGLDPIMANTINELIIDTQRRFSLTCVIISHDVSSIFTVGHRIAMLYEGKIIAADEAEALRNSDNEVVRQFLEGHPTAPIKI